MDACTGSLSLRAFLPVLFGYTNNLEGMIEDSILLSELKHNEERVCQWDFVLVGNNRLFYKDRGDGHGFDFYSVSLVYSEVNEEWSPDHTGVQLLYHGVAYFDGVRHLYMGANITGNEGYDYYPNISGHLETLKQIDILAGKYCRDYEKTTIL